MNCSLNCQGVQSQMADFSAGQLSPSQANAFEAHCASCASCRGEWETFQGTLQLLSALPQELPCEELSGEMWNCCCHDWMAHVEQKRHSKSPLQALSGYSYWINQQPRWAQGGWAASGVVVAGIALFVAGTWAISFSVPTGVDATVTASNASSMTSASSVLVDVPLPAESLSADVGPLIFKNRPQGNIPQLSAPSLVPGFEETSISSLPSRRIDFDATPFAASGNGYWNSHQSLSTQRFINRVNSGQLLESPAPVQGVPYSNATPFVFEVREKQVQVPVASSPPLAHGE